MHLRKLTAKKSKPGKAEGHKEGSRASFESRISQHSQPAVPPGYVPPVGGHMKGSSQRQMSPSSPRSNDNAADFGSHEEKIAAVSRASMSTMAKTSPASPSSPPANKGAASAEGCDTKRKSIPKSGFREGSHGASTSREVAGLGVRALNGSEDARLKGMQQYSGEKVFFLTMCHTLCEVDGRGSAWSPACNAAAREFEPFAKAFGCVGGSSMNPKEKCNFF
ncbi:uncharacterized protein [Dermacentor albipictus]|uniref:uncharacterized protein isoform X2 n=1 Tax=Dermacentor albipictus TaxID=60249 RepID=UPI0031FC3B6E